MSDKVNLFFFPEYQEGVDKDETREKLAKTLGVEEEKVETWFESTKPTIILKETDEATGNKFVEAIRGGDSWKRFVVAVASVIGRRWELMIDR